MTRNLFSSVFEKFNGYEIIKQDLACKEKIELTPINIVYERSYDEKIPVPCFFTDQIYMAYRMNRGNKSASQFDKGKEHISNRIYKALQLL